MPRSWGNVEMGYDYKPRNAWDGVALGGGPAPRSWDVYMSQPPRDEAPGGWSEQSPRVLSVDEAMGPRTDWASLRQGAQPQQRKRSGWDVATDAVVNVAHGAAAATGIPAWQRAAASLDRDVAMRASDDRAEAKAASSSLAELGRQQAAEDRERARYALHPMSEVNGQMVPLSAAMAQAHQRAMETVAGRNADRLESDSAWRHQDGEARVRHADEALGAQKSRWADLDAQHASDAKATSAWRATTAGETHRHNTVNEGRPVGGAGAVAAGGAPTPKLIQAAEDEALRRLKARTTPGQFGHAAQPVPLGDDEVFDLSREILRGWGFQMDDGFDDLPDPDDEMP